MKKEERNKWYIIFTIGFLPVLIVWIIAGLPKKHEVLGAITFSLTIFLLFFLIGWALYFLINDLLKNWKKFLLQERTLRIITALFLVLAVYGLIVFLILAMSP